MFQELLLPDIRQMLEEQDEVGLREFCDILHPAGVAEVLSELPPADAWRILAYCPLPLRVQIFEFLTVPQQVQLVEGIDRKELSQLIEVMSSDDRADLLGRLDEELVEEVLPLIAQAERADIRKLLSYPEYSAGSIMTTEYASVPGNITVQEAIQKLRVQAPKSETIYYVYVKDDERRLNGIVTLRQLILAKPTTLISDLMNRDVITMRVDEDQEDVAHQVSRYDFIAMPVVDEQHRLVGIITHDDVQDIIREEADEDVQRLGAVEPLQDDYLETPVTTLAWKRGKWLMFLSLVAFMTAEVLLRFEHVSAKHVWAVLFLPLVLASGGNAGSQSATLIIRALALRQETSSKQVWGLVGRETLVGLILGGMVSVLGFVVAYTWFERPALQASMVSLTVCLVVMLGTMSGLVLPIVSKRLGLDPALMSTPLITAIVDVLGVVLYYGVALWLLDVLSA
ncbi:magnesium transporter [Calycomorphotria hydatis]|uniref:Magnesium transporter MgtE n=1 Tax=Calycomorphotria hydatis TaxID=2528027 RepID=A0A517TCM5_9PLAN|nr:magnesium transporter [Calycomorphotria hydatis]QDT66125.1 Magnesium transporter MgtE [Calycomorphotria hydatis]